MAADPSDTAHDTAHDTGTGDGTGDGYEYEVKGDIQMEEDMYKVAFMHNDQSFVLGLFSNKEESERVCDVLSIKECVDAELDLRKLRLHFELAKYGVDNDTAGEIRSVSFRQVVRDLQVCAVRPIEGALTAAETGATSWANFTNSTRFHDAAETATVLTHTHTQRPAVPTMSVTGASLLGGGPRQGGVNLPPRVPRVAPSRSAAPGGLRPREPSAARAAFTAAGRANAAATAAGNPTPTSAPMLGQAAVEQDAKPPPPPPPAAEVEQQPQQQEEEQEQQEGSLPGQGTPGRPAPGDAEPRGAGPTTSPHRASTYTPKSARKRPHAEEEEEEQEERGQDAEGAAAGKPDAAHQEAQRRRKGKAPRVDAARRTSDEEPEAAGAADGDVEGAAQQRRGKQLGKRAAQQDAGSAGKGKGKGKRRRSSAAGQVAGERPWEAEDVMAFSPDNHPFHGITRMSARAGKAAANTFAAQIKLPTSHKGELKNIFFCKCDTPAEAAVIWDLGAIWRAVQAGDDPASLDADVEPSQALNFGFLRYKDVLPQLTKAKAYSDVQDLVKELRDKRTLAALAVKGNAAAAAAARAPPRAAEPAPAPAPARRGAAAAAAVPGPSAAAAADGAGSEEPQGLGGKRSSSGFRGVHGTGPWAAQVTVKAAKMLPQHQNEWTLRRGEQHLRVPACQSPEVAAACHDMLLLWRCSQYGDDPASAPLNFRLAGYSRLSPALLPLKVEAVVPHIVVLREAGKLQAVAAAGPSSRPAAPETAAAGPRPAGKDPAAQRQAAADAAGPGRASAGAGTAQAGPRAAASAPPPAAAATAAAAGPSSRQAPAAHHAPVARPAGSHAMLAPMPRSAQELVQYSAGLDLQGRLRASYRSDELPYVQMQACLSSEVHAHLARSPQLTETDVVAFMAVLVRQRDVRVVMHQMVKQLSDAGKHDLLATYVRTVVRPDMERM